MQLNYAAAVSVFYSSLFEYITFDIVPTDEIYGNIFNFESEPYSHEADSIGYGSRIFIENTGSLLVYLIVLGLQIAIAQFILKKLSKFKKLKKWAKTFKGGFIWSGAIDFQDELYLCVLFSLGIQVGDFEFTSVSTSFNNLFSLAMALQTIVVPPILVFKLAKKIKTATKAIDSGSNLEQLHEGGEKEESNSVLRDSVNRENSQA